jgi:hypothetical protein
LLLNLLHEQTKIQLMSLYLCIEIHILTRIFSFLLQKSAA